jgi:hypothetical protein
MEAFHGIRRCFSLLRGTGSWREASETALGLLAPKTAFDFDRAEATDGQVRGK